MIESSTQQMKEFDKNHALTVLEAFDERAKEYAVMTHLLPESEWHSAKMRYETAKKFLKTLIEAAYR